MPKAQVLILEEEHDMAEKFNPILIESGYETFQAHSLHEAYQHAKQSRPDVILVGDNFHKHSGLEICEELRGEIDTAMRTFFCSSRQLTRVSRSGLAKQELTISFRMT